MSAAASADAAHLVCPGHTRGVTHVSFIATAEYDPVAGLQRARESEDGAEMCGPFLLSASIDGTASLRDGVTGDWIGTFQGHKGAVWCARKAPNQAPLIATASADYTAKLFDMDNGTERASLVHDHVVKAVDWSADSALLVTGGMRKKLRVFDVATQSETLCIAEGVGGAVRALRWLAGESSSIVACGGTDANVRLFDMRTGSLAATLETPGPVLAIELSVDGASLCVASASEALIFDTARLALTHRMRCSAPVESVALSPDGSRCAIASTDCRVYVTSTASEAEAAAAVLRGHHGPVHAAAWSLDGAIIATGADDSTVRLWRAEGEREYGLWRSPATARPTPA